MALTCSTASASNFLPRFVSSSYYCSTLPRPRGKSEATPSLLDARQCAQTEDSPSPLLCTRVNQERKSKLLTWVPGTRGRAVSSACLGSYFVSGTLPDPLYPGSVPKLWLQLHGHVNQGTAPNCSLRLQQRAGILGRPAFRITKRKTRWRTHRRCSPGRCP